jgi:hypothetical protein
MIGAVSFVLFFGALLVMAPPADATAPCRTPPAPGVERSPYLNVPAAYQEGRPPAGERCPSLAGLASSPLRHNKAYVEYLERQHLRDLEPGGPGGRAPVGRVLPERRSDPRPDTAAPWRLALSAIVGAIVGGGLVAGTRRRRPAAADRGPLLVDLGLLAAADQAEGDEGEDGRQDEHSEHRA